MIHFPSFDDSAVAAAFTEACDGNMSFKGGPELDAVAAARARVCHALGVAPADLVCVAQVHGAEIALVDEADRGRGALDGDAALPRADGLITNVRRLPLAILTADCVPVFLVAPKSRVVALIHAGRSGTLANICGSAIALMGQAYGVAPPDVHAVIGPSAGPQAYEVSEEMAQDWAARGLPAQGRRLDLWGANRAQLEASGVPRGQIAVAGLCTILDERFFSFRRERTACRNMGVLLLR